MTIPFDYYENLSSITDPHASTVRKIEDEQIAKDRHGILTVLFAVHPIEESPHSKELKISIDSAMISFFMSNKIISSHWNDIIARAVAYLHDKVDADDSLKNDILKYFLSPKINGNGLCLTMDDMKDKFSHHVMLANPVSEKKHAKLVQKQMEAKEKQKAADAYRMYVEACRERKNSIENAKNDYRQTSVSLEFRIRKSKKELNDKIEALKEQYGIEIKSMEYAINESYLRYVKVRSSNVPSLKDFEPNN